MSQNDDAVKNEVVADTTADSAPVDKSVVASDPLGDDAFDDIDEEVAKSGETDSDEDDEEESSETETTEETKPVDKPQDGDKTREESLAPKSQNRFQKLANENRELKEQLERLKSQETQVATEQELLNEVNPETGDYYTPAEAERIARQQALEAQQKATFEERQNLELQQHQEVVGNESRQALQDFPMLNPESKDFKPEIAAEYDSILAENLIYEYSDGNRYPRSVLEANGINPDTQAKFIGSNISPYKLAKLTAKSAEANAALYQANAQRSTERMLANADATGGAPQTKAKDSNLDDFDKGWDS